MIYNREGGMKGVGGKGMKRGGGGVSGGSARILGSNTITSVVNMIQNAMESLTRI